MQNNIPESDHSFPRLSLIDESDLASFNGIAVDLEEHCGIQFLSAPMEQIKAKLFWVDRHLAGELYPPGSIIM